MLWLQVQQPTADSILTVEASELPRTTLEVRMYNQSYNILQGINNQKVTAESVFKTKKNKQTDKQTDRQNPNNMHAGYIHFKINRYLLLTVTIVIVGKPLLWINMFL